MNGDDDLTDKISKEEANYRYSSDPKIVCGVCANYLPGEDGELYSVGGCSVVAGATRYVDVCDYFAPSGSKRPAPPLAGSLPGGLEEARRSFAESYGETIGDSKFPEPRDPWTTGETEGGHDHQHAAAAVEALMTAGWRPTGKSALVWNHPRLKGHEIEIEARRFFHKVAGLVSHVGEHSKLADHVKTASRIYKIAEANRSFNIVYED
jgi:hypothetical protein